MSGTVQLLMLVANLGKDPELKQGQNGNHVCKFSVATSDRYKAADGEWKERTEWFNVVCFGRTAENAERYLRKGSKVAIEGRIQSHEYEQDGVKKWWTEVVVRNLTFLDSRQDNQGDRGQQQGGGGGYGGNKKNQGVPMPAPPKQGSLTDDEDPLPF